MEHGFALIQYVYPMESEYFCFREGLHGDHECACARIHPPHIHTHHPTYQGALQKFLSSIFLAHFW